MKIHISETTKEILDEIGGFKLEKRGEIEIKVRIFDSNFTQIYFSYHFDRAKEPWKHSG